MVLGFLEDGTRGRIWRLHFAPMGLAGFADDAGFLRQLGADVGSTQLFDWFGAFGASLFEGINLTFFEGAQRILRFMFMLDRRRDFYRE